MSGTVVEPKPGVDVGRVVVTVGVENVEDRKRADHGESENGTNDDDRKCD